MSVTVSKWGNSLGVRLPQSVVKQLDINANDRLEFIVSKNTITFEKATNALTLEDLFKNYNGEEVVVAPIIPAPMGDEKW